MEQEKKGAFHIVEEEKHQWGNKLGKWLAGAVRENKSILLYLKLKTIKEK